MLGTLRTPYLAVSSRGDSSETHDYQNARFRCSTSFVTGHLVKVISQDVSALLSFDLHHSLEPSVPSDPRPVSDSSASVVPVLGCLDLYVLALNSDNLTPEIP